MSPANSLTSSNPENEPPLEVKCFDPDHPDQACPLCGGLAMLAYGVPYGDPNFGKMYPCPNRPVDRTRQERLRKLGNMDAFKDKTLGNFQRTRAGYTVDESSSLNTAVTYAEAFAREPIGWLLFTGHYGTGKTHLAAGIGNARLAAGDTVVFMTTPDLLDHLRNSFASSSEYGYDEVFERIKESQLLILDDLGAENPSEWAMEKLFQLLNHRYTYHLPTVITTNTDLHRLDGRLSSRLSDTNVVMQIGLKAPDYRNADNNYKINTVLQSLAPYQHMSFDNFDAVTNLPAEESSNLNYAAHEALKFAHNPKKWLIFTGAYGVGKTHLAASVGNYSQMRGTKVSFVTMPDLLDVLKATFSSDSLFGFDELFDTIRSVQLFILDDLNLDGAKPWAQEKIFQLLDYRYVRTLPTVITTSRSINDIKQSNPRLVTRLTDTRICDIIAIQARNYGTRLRGR